MQGAIWCQAAGLHLGARCTQASVHLLRDSLITHNTMNVPKRPDAPRCTVHLGARRPGCTLVQVHKRPDAPRCTVQYGARRPGCTTVQVHGDPSAPHQGAWCPRAPCTLVRCTGIAMHLHRGASRPPGTILHRAPWCIRPLMHLHQGASRPPGTEVHRAPRCIRPLRDIHSVVSDKRVS